MEVHSSGSVAANDNNKYCFYVYAWLYPDGRPFYVGKGKSDRDVRPKNHNPLFTRIVAKIARLGGRPHVVRWQRGLREDAALRLETAYIKLFGRRDNGTGILANMTDGGEGISGLVHSAKTRAKMSKAQSGRTNSPEARAKLSVAMRGKTHSAETRAKLSELWLGRSHGEESRLRMSAAQRGRTFTPEARAKISVSISAIIKHQPVRADNTSGFKGVSFRKDTGKWSAYISIAGERRNLGSFITPEAAAIAYDTAALAAWGVGNCYLNFQPKIFSA